MVGSMLRGEIPLGTRRPLNKFTCGYDLKKEAVSCHWTNLQRGDIHNLRLKKAVFSGQSVCTYRLKPVSSLSSEDADSISKESSQFNGEKSFKQWDTLTAKFAGAANLPFLLLQLPQIILNTRNLVAGNKSALLAIPWLGMLTGLLGNLSLVSYFIKKSESEAIVVQTLGVISMYIVLLQLAMGEAMPTPHFITTTIVVAFGLIFNFMKYFNLLNEEIWHFWEDFITVAGLSTLPQVMWSTFVPYLPNTILPGAVAFTTSVIAILMARMGKLSHKGVEFLGSVSGWTATLLFMWMAVAQMWTNLLNPDNIRGLSAVTMLLGVAGNGLLIPRALFIRDFMWFTGSSWGTVFYGWGNLVSLYCFNGINSGFFWASTLGLLAWIGLTFWKDAQAHGLGSPVASLKELVFGSR